MLIAVIAANGRSGSEFVEAALMAGHNVRAGVLGSHDQLPDHHKIAVYKCDATKLHDVVTLSKGCDAIVSFIGHGKKTPKDVQTKCIKNCIQAAQKNNISRIVSLTGTGVRFPGDKITPVDQLMNLSISIIDPARVKDGIQHARILQKSDLDWTIIRVLKLTNGKLQKYSLRRSGPTRIFTSRKTVAAAALSAIENKAFKKEAPIVCRHQNN